MDIFKKFFNFCVAAYTAVAGCCVVLSRGSAVVMFGGGGRGGFFLYSSFTLMDCHSQYLVLVSGCFTSLFLHF